MRFHHLVAACLLAFGLLSAVFAQGGTAAPSVFLSGQVNRPGLHALQPGETLRSLLQRTGGIRPTAYLFGLDLRRQREFERQQSFLREWGDYLHQYSQRTDDENLRYAVDEQEEAKERLRAQHALIGHFIAADVDGRLVLNLSPELDQVDALPDLPLEAGDRINIPPPPPRQVRLVGVDGIDGSFAVEQPTDTETVLKSISEASIDSSLYLVFLLRADGRVLRYQPDKASTALVRPGDTLVFAESPRDRALNPQVGLWCELIYPQAIEYTAARIVER